MGVTKDLIIIGAGYWGCGIAIEARKAGKSVMLIDNADPMSGTRAASGICDPKSYTSQIFAKLLPVKWEKRLSELDYSFDWLLKNGGYNVQEYFWNEFQGRDPREGAKCIYIDSPASFRRPVEDLVYKDDFHQAWTEGGFWKVAVLSHSMQYRCKDLVIAAGRYSGVILGKCGLKSVAVGSLYGRGIIARGTPTTDLPCSVMIRPYCKHTVRAWAGRTDLFKVGDTAEPKPRENAFTALQKVGQHCLGEGMEVVEISEGYRPVMDEFTVEKVGPNCVLATGGHRVGLGLTGLVAKETLEMLK